MQLRFLANYMLLCVVFVVVEVSLLMVMSVKIFRHIAEIGLVQLSLHLWIQVPRLGQILILKTKTLHVSIAA